MGFFCVEMAKNGCHQSGYETLKLNVSQERAVGINWFLAWYYKFRKAKSCFNGFLGSRGLLVHETLKSTVS